MPEEWGHANDIFDQGYRAMRKGLLTLGVFLVALAILIFIFPEFIAFLFASFILFAGVSILLAAYRVWKMKNRIFDWQDSFGPYGEGDNMRRQRTITFILR
ncbi:MAG: hypothetical protein JSU88_09035 [Nitrospinaceae bacterium]|jgi:hypothetical protein|nr:MAG: hypothetical protein JSU88_09035 [Nitrospinaceae bacterium]